MLLDFNFILYTLYKTKNMIQPFHLAIPFQNLEKCRTFYSDILNCEEGRSTDYWVDFNFFGHQLVIHQKDGFNPERISNPVDGLMIYLE